MLTYPGKAWVGVLSLPSDGLCIKSDTELVLVEYRKIIRIWGNPYRGSQLDTRDAHCHNLYKVSQNH